MNEDQQTPAFGTRMKIAMKSDWREIGVTRRDQGKTKKDMAGAMAKARDAMESDKKRNRELLQCSPRVSVVIISNNVHNKEIKLVSAQQNDTRFPTWDNMGTAYFRGTIKDLDAATCTVEVEDMTATRRRRLIAKGTISLQGVVDYSFLRVDMGPPSWLTLMAKLEGWQAGMKKWKFGTVEGKVSIANIPKYRQFGEVVVYDKNRIYLFVSVQEIDNLVTPEQRASADSFVQFSFDGQSKLTRIIEHSIQPAYNCEVAIPMRLPDKSEISASDIEGKDRVWLDVWAKGATMNEHCGACSFTLWDLVYERKQGQHRRKIDKKFMDSETGKEVTFSTAVLESKSRLQFVYSTDRESTLVFEAWTMPDLLEFTGLESFEKYTGSGLPDPLAQKFSQYEQKLSKVVDVQSKKLEVGSRFYFHMKKDQRKEEHFLPRFIGKVVPPKDINSPAAIFQYARCVPFLLPNRSEIWITPDFTITARSGSAVEHALLHCSLLIGEGIQAFVCFGTLWNRTEHAWVVTFHFDKETEYGYVRFWETTTGYHYTLRGRFRDTQIIHDIFERPETMNKHLREKAEAEKNRKRRRSILDILKGEEETPQADDEDANDGDEVVARLPEGKADEEGNPAMPAPKLPYRSIEFIFNHLNMWVNLQSPNPGKMWFDIWRKDYWHQFSPENHDIRPCFIPKANGSLHTEVQQAIMISSIKERVNIEIQVHRNSRNLGTRWNKDPKLIAFLERGCDLLYQYETAHQDHQDLAEAKVKEWRKQLFAKVPPAYRLRGKALHFNFHEPKSIGDAVVAKCEFLESRDRSAQFSVGICLKSVPGELISVYVYLIIVQKVPDREMRKIKEQQELERRQKEKKRLQRELKKQAAADGVEENEDEEEESTPVNPQQIEDVADPNEEMVDEDPQLDAEPPQDDAAGVIAAVGEAEQKKKKKKDKKKRPDDGFDDLDGDSLIPTKPKTRKVKIPEHSEHAALLHERQYYADVNWKSVAKSMEVILGEALRVDSSRVIVYQCEFNERRMVFAITPPDDPSGSDPTADALMEELGAILPNMVSDDVNFTELTGEWAVLEWGGVGSYDEHKAHAPPAVAESGVVSEPKEGQKEEPQADEQASQAEHEQKEGDDEQAQAEQAAKPEPEQAPDNEGAPDAGGERDEPPLEEAGVAGATVKKKKKKKKKTDEEKPEEPMEEAPRSDEPLPEDPQAEEPLPTEELAGVARDAQEIDEEPPQSDPLDEDVTEGAVVALKEKKKKKKRKKKDEDPYEELPEDEPPIETPKRDTPPPPEVKYAEEPAAAPPEPQKPPEPEKSPKGGGGWFGSLWGGGAAVAATTTAAAPVGAAPVGAADAAYKEEEDEVEISDFEDKSPLLKEETAPAAASQPIKATPPPIVATTSAYTQQEARPPVAAATPAAQAVGEPATPPKPTEPKLTPPKTETKPSSPQPVAAPVTPSATPSVPSSIAASQPASDDYANQYAETYGKLRDEDPEMFDQLYDYYVSQGHPHQNALYYAAYYLPKYLEGQDGRPQSEEDTTNASRSKDREGELYDLSDSQDDDDYEVDEELDDEDRGPSDGDDVPEFYYPPQAKDPGADRESNGSLMSVVYTNTGAPKKLKKDTVEVTVSEDEHHPKIKLTKKKKSFFGLGIGKKKGVAEPAAPKGQKPTFRLGKK
eukprot:GHVN01059777.1.p1 GENE.GHVN01059777.1~~GHVN01059777.1.p1  ORF type:complete len:1658 (+),score=314.68 GHVN01059777.1:177-5150(+)